MRVANEGIEVGVQAEIEARRELICVVGAGEDTSQGAKLRCGRLDAVDAPLIRALVIREEECPVPPNRSAHLKSELAALKKGVGIRRIPAEPRIRCQVV